ncbi:TIGR03067 domain-containing protein [Blastopirellula marina]|nr:TIGR03067 domain-containing protein [Blastopirellula marina]
MRFAAGKGLSALGVALLLLSARFMLAAEPDKSWPTDGRWNVERMVSDGIEIPIAKSPTPTFFEIDGERWNWVFSVSGKKVTAEFRVARVDEAALNAVQLNGAYQGQTCAGIYRLEGDLLTLCLCERQSDPRPTKFESKPGSRRYLFVVRRLAGSEEAGE